MDYKDIEKKMQELNKRGIPEETRKKLDEDFEAEYTFHTLALSGSSLTLEEVKAILNALRRKNGGNK